MSEHIVLHFETQNGRYPDTAIVAQALIDWTELVTAAITAIDPNQQVDFEIVGVEPGSTRIPQILKFLDTQVEYVKTGWGDYPHLKNVIAGAAHTFYTATVAAGVTLAMQPDEQIVRLSDKDREIFNQAANSKMVENSSQKFYRTLERDRAITGVGVGNDWSKRPSLIIPSEQFPERAGLWDIQESETPTRPQQDIWDVVLLRPALLSTPQSWQFIRDGLKFSAKMHDAKFLAAIGEGKIPLKMQEGVIMRVQVEWKEALVGQTWEPMPRTRRVVRVLSPVPGP